MRNRAMAAAALALALTGACGGGSEKSQTAPAGTRTVDVDMVDIGFQPAAVPVKAGEKVRFVFHNRGAQQHDAFLGDEKAQADHESETRKVGMGGMHDSADAIDVEPGKTGSITHTFAAGDRLLIGCHEEGHYAAGMKLAITVT